MTKERKFKIGYILISILLIAFFLFALFYLTRSMSLSQDKESFCKWKFGEEFYRSDFGDRCEHLNYETGIKEERYFQHEELDKYCPRPKFFEITKWEGKCIF